VTVTVLWTTMAVVLFLCTLIAHEAAHALALRKLGIPIVEVGVGLPIPPSFTFRPTWLPFRVSLSPWLIGAYVMPDPKREADIEALPYRDQAWYCGAGVVANISLGAFLWATADVLSGHWRQAIVLITIGILAWVLRRSFCAYLIPLLSLAGLVFLGWVLLHSSPSEPQGVVGIGRLLLSSSLQESLVTAGACSLAVGVLNIVPLFPLDGGRIVGALVGRWGSQRWLTGFQLTGTLTFLGLLIYTVGSDLHWLLF
jgi:Zn-dependent protease